MAGVRGQAAFIELRTTLDDRRRASELVREVIASRLAACGQVSGPVESTYRWKGAVEGTEEWLCSFKTTAALAPALRDFILERHPYEVPEIVVFEVVATSDDYGEWVRHETK